MNMQTGRMRNQYLKVTNWPMYLGLTYAMRTVERSNLSAAQLKSLLTVDASVVNMDKLDI